MCHALLQSPNFFRLLLRIDEELASETQAAGCRCGGVLHRANYPRKPRACLSEVRGDFESRLSFCCNLCRRRTTSMSVRFLGRRVYLALAVVLVSARHAVQNPAARRLSGTKKTANACHPGVIKTNLSRNMNPVMNALFGLAGPFTLNALLDAQELDSRASTGTVYWEGLSALADATGRQIGLGYLEMTGYAGRLAL